MKLLLHTCCAPCLVQCAAALAEEEKKPDLFWYNPNIHPYTEYRARRDTLKNFAEEINLVLIINDEYGLRPFIKAVIPFCENRNTRCSFCYTLRLEKTARYAAENSYDSFSTTLLISPYQNHDLIRRTGEKLAAEYGVKFLYRDFRPRFRTGQNEAREAGYYMQKYCGCIFSEEERYLSKNTVRKKRSGGQ